MTRLQTLAIVAAMIVCFSTAIAVKLVQRDSGALPLQRMAHSLPPSSQGMTSNKSAPSEIPHAGSTSSIDQTAVAQPTFDAIPSSDAIAPANQAGPELPLMVSFRTREPEFEDERAEGKAVVEGVLESTTDADLTVTVIEVNGNTRETTQAEIAFFGAIKTRTFGKRDGLTMQSGDQIILRSPTYRERLSQVP